MTNKTDSRFRLPNRGFAAGLVAGFILSVSFATWAAHDPIDPGTMTMFEDGYLITAEPFNEMFTELYDWAAGIDTHIQMQDAEIAARVINASPCGETTAVDGSLGGYAGAAALCAALDTCSDTAHMCTSEEMLRHFASGGDLNGFSDSTRWVSSGVGSHSDTYGFIDDCVGWNATVHSGTVWHQNDHPDFGYCTTSYPILCCD